jgi:hypothetical protein
MDMRLPGIDGYTLTRRIKATRRGQATVIVALTASALEEDRAGVLAAGCDDYIRKPFREEELMAALERHLDVRFLSEETPAAPPARAPTLPAAALSGLPRRAAGCCPPATLRRCPPRRRRRHRSRPRYVAAADPRARCCRWRGSPPITPSTRSLRSSPLPEQELPHDRYQAHFP